MPRPALFATALHLMTSFAALAQAWTPTTDPALRPPEPQREFRGAWVATVANIDWPSKPGLSVPDMRAEMTRILDEAVRLNLNALVVQVRPSCDAIYPSALEPWSEFLTGQSGRPPGDPGCDPLAEWVAGAHARGIELHAWFNPFRARHFEAKGPDAHSHVSQGRPDLVKAYDNYLWLDPGEPDARAHSLAVIADVVARYDIDGVHIDDYFYPYPKPGVPFPDSASFVTYAAAGGTLTLDAWRRDNIDRFVQTMYEQVKRAKPWVKVGISPFGIWRPGSPPGIAGFDPYDKLSADARRWLREGWLDYVSPQLYWPIDQRPQSYTRLLDWWVANNDQRRHVWVGNNTSRVLAADAATPGSGATPRASWEPAEILRQIEATRAANLGPGGAGGNIHFSMIALVQNRRGVCDALRAGPYALPALVPASPWLAGGVPPPGVPTVTGVRSEGSLEIVTLNPAPGGGVGPTPPRWLVWAKFGPNWKWVVADGGLRELPLDRSTADGDLAVIAVASLDRIGRLSEPVVLSRTASPR